MRPDKKFQLALMVTAMLVGVVVIALVVGGGSQDTPDVPDVPVDPEEPEEPDVPVLPEGFSFDGRTMVLSYETSTDWHIIDMYHTYMADSDTVYSGYDVDSSASVTLEPGKYSISAAGEEFVMSTGGTADREFVWIYDMDGTDCRMTVGFSIPVDEFTAACDANGEINSVKGNKTLFEDLTRLVVVDHVITEIESKLASEYARIGGSVSDRQGYADFVSSFVQLNITYPPRVGSGYDGYVWGMEEYWCVPIETLWHVMGDCEDTSALLCSLLKAAGYDVAMGGHAGHVFSGVHIDGYAEVGQERLDELGAGNYKPCAMEGIVSGGAFNKPVYGPEGYLYYAVETTRDQIPVGYLMGGTDNLDKATWSNGWAGFYPVSG